jgi:hypothetical protein
MQDYASIRLPQPEARPFGQRKLTTAADIPSYVVSLVLLGLSIFSIPRISGQRALILAGLMAVGFYLTLGRGKTRRHAIRRGVALYTVILISVYFITFTRYDHSEVLLGTTPMAFASLLAFLALAAWSWRVVNTRSLPAVTPALDLALLALASISLIAYLRVLALHRQYGVALEPRAHLTWVVIVSTLVYCIVNDLGRSALAAQLLRAVPLPLFVSCTIAAIWNWL